MLGHLECADDLCLITNSIGYAEKASTEMQINTTQTCVRKKTAWMYVGSYLEQSYL